VREAYTRRETLAAALLGVAVAALTWGPVVLRSFDSSHTVDLGTLRSTEGRGDSQSHPLVRRVKIAKATPGGRIDINRADAEAFQSLPGIGPTLAQRIIAFRKDHGPFADTRGLLDVSGIGPKRFDKVEPWIEVR